jgi:hypothetical protein
MQRLVITPKLLVGGGCLGIMAGAAIDAEACSAGAAIPQPRDSETFLQIDNTSDVARSVTLRAGVNASAATAADLTLTVAAGETAFLGPFESAAFVQADGDLYVDFESGFTGTVRAIQAPRI